MTAETRAELDRIFHPRSVSIIGASNRQGSFGRLFLEGFIRMGFKEIFPVHPREKELLGLTAYAGIKEIPYEVDLAVLLVPQSEALKVVRECGEKKVKGIVLFTAGFREKNAEGQQLEEEIVRAARQGGARLIGPNTNGLYCPASRLLTLPSSLIVGGLPTESGGLSVFAQSGSFSDYLSIELTTKNVRFSKVVSSGNESDLTAADYLDYFGADGETRIIAGYIEGLRDGRLFYELCRGISPRKPIILWKGGLTETGARAALAHTGALAGARQVWEAMFRQAGITAVHSFEEMVGCILAFYWLPLPRGRRVAILSGMGGTNIGTADNCVMMGLEIARLGDGTRERLGQLLTSAGTAIANPLDVGVGSLMNPAVYGETAKVLAADENVDMLIVIAGPDNALSLKSIIEVAPAIDKPMVVSIFDIPGLVEPLSRDLLGKHIPVYRDPRTAGFALARLVEYAEFRKKKSGETSL